MAHVSGILFTLLFADDTNAFIRGDNVNQMIKTMNIELQHLVKWMYANKLSLNVDKTHFIVFRSSGMKKPVFTEKLIINNEMITQETQTKFLGVIIDQKLTWGPHINFTKSKIAKGIGIICKTKSLLNTSTLVTLYNSFIYPYLNYAIEIWGDTHECYLNTLVKLQKKAVRIITKSPFLAHTQPLFEQLRILNLEKIHVYKIGIVMFKVYDNSTPSIFSDLFKYNHTVHNYGTRQSYKFHVPIAPKDYLQRTIAVKGVRIWNTLYDLVPHDCSLITFKYHLRKYLQRVTDIDHI